MKLGVCYYPEQWPEAWWADDALRMRRMGISLVRIGEFAWSELEPEPGQFDWSWLDRAVETLHAAGLSVVLCTPTATPPKWLVDQHPDILAVDARGLPRRFGSRRHYCFSSRSYRAESQRITRLIVERYGKHPAVAAWQTDNEYGCHDTVLSYSTDARLGFRRWLAARYRDIGALNAAWGTTFWSQRYRGFDAIDPPVATVTEANPSHRLDWQRFASDEVVAFNREQVAILRECAPGRPIAHNFMGFFTGFDHHDVAADLDIAGWDSYPLGFTQMFFLADAEKQRWARCGHPDIPGFHHDLYRGMCGGRWWVMEQQPGPVNWAHWNPAPHDGMVRLWTWQAFAHGAEVVSYFRWRQAPFGQEQMHAGLLRPDRSDDQGAIEAAQVGAELRSLAASLEPGSLTVKAPVALLLDYPSLWMSQIQPQGADYNALELSFRVYSALRGLGLDVDIVAADAALDGYRLVVLPAQWQVSNVLAERLAQCDAEVVLGPRCGSKTEDFRIPPNLAPGALAGLCGNRVLRVASLPPGLVEEFVVDGVHCYASRWREDLQLVGAVAESRFADGAAAISRHGRVRYVAAWLDGPGWTALLRRAATDAGLTVQSLPEGLRINRLGPLTFAFNFADVEVSWSPAETDRRARALLGGARLPSHGLAIWKT